MHCMEISAMAARHYCNLTFLFRVFGFTSNDA